MQNSTPGPSGEKNTDARIGTGSRLLADNGDEPRTSQVDIVPAPAPRSEGACDGPDDVQEQPCEVAQRFADVRGRPASEAAGIYIEAGFFVVPVPHREKGATRKGWQKLRVQIK